MASQQFDKYRALLEANRPPGDRVKVSSMRRDMDAVGGKLGDGVTGSPARVGGVGGEWVDADGADPGAALLYLHGGGYVAGSVDSHRNLLGHLARAMRCRVFAADYRLAPENPHPAPVDDAVAAYLGLLDEGGFDPGRVAVAGDSAGGGLTVATLVALRDRGHPLPAAAVAISPWIDLEATGSSAVSRAAADPMVTPGSLRTIAAMFVGDDGDVRDPLAAPLHADLAGLPPMLVHVGDAEVLLDDSNRLAAKITEAGGDVTLEVWPEMVHVWHGSAGYVPESDEAIARIAEYLGPKLGLASA